MLPITTSYLKPDEYGKLSLFMMLIAIYAAFINMNMFAVISKEFHKVSKSELSLYIGNIIIILMISTLIYFLVTIGFWFSDFGLLGDGADLLLLAPLIVFMMTINNINTVILRNENRAWMYGIFEVSNSAIVITVTIILLTNGIGWMSQIFGILVAGGIFCIIGSIYISKRNYVKLSFDKTVAKKILTITVPLIPHALGALIIASSDRFFIEKMISLEAVGLYAVGYSFGKIVQIFTDAF
ncbi:hypothetical protein BZG83_16455, partial [Salinivibrio sp. PR919]